MAENTSIEWAHHSFNPWIGCTRVGPGCEHCYAEVRDRRKMLGPVSHWGPGAPRHRTSASTWAAPRRWDRRCAQAGIRERVFCASLADVFDNEVPAEWRAELFALIRATPNLDWLLVTKRIGNAAKMAAAAGGWPSNVWLGATVVNQEEADRDVPKLLATAGPRFRFLSMEPLLGPVNLEEAWHGSDALNPECWVDCAWCESGFPPLHNCQRGLQEGGNAFFHPTGRSGLDWIIVGGESGPGARPMNPDWVILIRDLCEQAGVPFFFKQWGEWQPEHSLTRLGAEYCYSTDGSGVAWRRVGKKAAGRELDGATHSAVPA